MRLRKPNYELFVDEYSSYGAINSNAYYPIVNNTLFSVKRHSQLS